MTDPYYHHRSVLLRLILCAAVHSRKFFALRLLIPHRQEEMVILVHARVLNSFPRHSVVHLHTVYQALKGNTNHLSVHDMNCCFKLFSKLIFLVHMNFESSLSSKYLFALFLYLCLGYGHSIWPLAV